MGCPSSLDSALFKQQLRKSLSGGRIQLPVCHEKAAYNQELSAQMDLDIRFFGDTGFIGWHNIENTGFVITRSFVHFTKFLLILLEEIPLFQSPYGISPVFYINVNPAIIRQENKEIESFRLFGFRDILYFGMEYIL